MTPSAQQTKATNTAISPESAFDFEIVQWLRSSMVYFWYLSSFQLCHEYILVELFSYSNNHDTKVHIFCISHHLSSIVLWVCFGGSFSSSSNNHDTIVQAHVQQQQQSQHKFFMKLNEWNSTHPRTCFLGSFPLQHTILNGIIVETLQTGAVHHCMSRT